MVTSAPDIQVVTPEKQPENLSGNSFFFHSRTFVFRNPCDTLRTFIIKKSEKAIARISFHIEGNSAFSLSRSPFGGIEMAPATLKESLSYGMARIIEQLNPISKIWIRSYPECYQPQDFEEQAKALLKAGFKVVIEDVNQHLSLTDKPFRSLVHDTQYRHLNFGRKKGNRFEQLDLDSFDTVYELLEKNRKTRGYPMTMDKAELFNTIKDFPDRYFLFGFFVGKILAAASVCIRVNSKILYDFYHGHDARFSKHSPVVPLLEGIYNFAFEQGYSILDLGISSDEGVVNKGLFSFKERIGAKTSSKPTFLLEINDR